MENELYHHGVLGMKWGVRHYQNKDGSLTSLGRSRRRKGSSGKSSTSKATARFRLKKSSKKKTTRQMSDDAKAVAELRKKKVYEMSNKELEIYNKRAGLEQRYQQVNPNKYKKGLAYVTAASGLMGTAIAVYNNSNTLIKIGKNFIKK